jgi:hypothetical protein
MPLIQIIFALNKGQLIWETKFEPKNRDIFTSFTDHDPWQSSRSRSKIGAMLISLQKKQAGGGIFRRMLKCQLLRQIMRGIAAIYFDKRNIFKYGGFG